LNAFGLHRKKEETLALFLEENVRKNLAKPWISNRQIYVGSGTVLTQKGDCFRESAMGVECIGEVVHRIQRFGGAAPSFSRISNASSSRPTCL
jgi:hypothetical protein